MVYRDKAKLTLGIKNVGFVVFGNFLLAFATAVFLVPFELVTGGVSGAAIVIAHIFPIGYLGVELAVAVLTWALFFVGLTLLGRAFAAKTLLSSIVYPLAFSACVHLTDPRVLGGYFDLSAHEHPDLALLLAAIVGGALVGLGCAIAFLGGGSTGGTDIIALAICKFHPKLHSSHVIFFIDAVIVLAGALVIGDIVVTMLGIVSALACAGVIDRLSFRKSFRGASLIK